MWLQHLKLFLIIVRSVSGVGYLPTLHALIPLLNE